MSGTRILAAVLVVAGACSQSGESSAEPTAVTTSTVGRATNVSVAPTTTAASEATTAISPVTSQPSGPAIERDFTLGTPSLGVPDPLEGSGGAAGSGCSPPGSQLPDGIWFGYLHEVKASAVVFDLACFFAGDDASAAALTDGEPEPPNSFYIRNENAQLRRVEVATQAPVYVIVAPPDSDLTLAEASLGDFTTVADAYNASFVCPGEFCGMWLYINNGEATQIVELYLP